MLKSVIVNATAAKSMVELAKKRIEEIDAELAKMNDLKEEKRSLANTIDQLLSSDSNSSYDPKYVVSWTWMQKIRYLLELAKGESMTTSRIAAEVMLREPTLDKRRVVSTLSSILSTSKDDGIKSLKNDRGEKIYSIPYVNIVTESFSTRNVEKDDLPF